ncbi:uncharacterized protein DS421_20g684440 [Arachis hypogaea]|nr:uncharacterized protein DS421_20g684440 [Arachis hypogaea]
MLYSNGRKSAPKQDRIEIGGGENLMDDWLQGKGNGQEEEKGQGTDLGSEMEAGMDGGSKFHREEQRPSWEEEMAENKEAWKLVIESENKEAWKLAVESGAQCSDEEDIMAILQEQNEAIALKRRQAKQKAKVRRSRPKNRKQVCNNFVQ